MSDLNTALAQAEALIDLRRFQEVIELLTPVAASHPENTEVALALGNAHWRLDNNEQARRYVTDVLVRDPGSADGLALLALVSLDLNDLPTADRASQQLVAVEPHSYRALYVGARTAVTGWGVASEAAFPKRSVLKAYQQRSDALVARLLEYYPNASGTQITRALHLNNIYGRHEAAISALRRALEIDPENADAIRILAALTDNSARSIHLARKSLAIDPENEHAVALACGVAGLSLRKILFWLIPLTLTVSLLAREWVILKVAALIFGLVLIAVLFRSEAADGQPLSAAQRRLYRRMRPKRWFLWWLCCGAVLAFNLTVALISSPDLTSPFGMIGLVFALIGGLVYVVRTVIVISRNSKTSRVRQQAVSENETLEDKQAKKKARAKQRKSNALIMAIPLLIVIGSLITRWQPEPEIPDFSGQFKPMEVTFTEPVKFRVTVAEGTAHYSYEGTLRGEKVNGEGTIDSAQQQSVGSVTMVDKGSGDFSVTLTSDAAGANAELGCEIEVGGVVTVKQTGAGSITCDLAAAAETTKTTQVLVADNFESLDYSVGDCLTLTADSATTSTAPVDCATEHDAQVMSVVPYPKSSNTSGTGNMNPENADALCAGDAFTAFIGVLFHESDLGTAVLYPGATARTLTDSNVLCLVQSSNGKTTGSLQNAGH